MIAKTEFEVARYLPFDDYGLGVNTARLFLKNLTKGLLAFVAALFIAGFDSKYFVVGLIVGLATYIDSFIKWKRKQEKNILRQLSTFLTELRHQYYRNNDVEEAFDAAFDTAGEELKLHLGLIENEFANEGIAGNYREAVPSRFLVLFATICQCAIRYGNGDDTFNVNIDELQKNIDSDLLKWDREEFLFGSVFFILAFAVATMPLMEKWAVSQVSELSLFYNGYKGSIARVVSIFITMVILIFFEKMQENRKEEISPLLSAILETKPVNKFLEERFKNEDSSGKMAKIFEEYFPERSYSHFVLMRLIWFVSSFIVISIWIFKWKLSIIFLPLALIFSILASFIPHLMLVIDGMFYESELEEEIGQVRLMTMSLSSAVGMTLEDILLWLEKFTLYLRESISICIDQLGTDEGKALENLRERWKFSEFTNIADDLISSDRIGIKEAFKDIFSRRDYYTARRRQEQELNVRKKEAILSTFMYLPFMLTTGLYMIVPFLYVSLKNLIDITKGFK